MKLARKLNATNLIAALLFLFSLATLSFALYMNANIHVLKGWKLSVDTQNVHPGDTLIVQSSSTKILNVTGTSSRYIECKSAQGIFVRYPINQATANRGAGTGTIGIQVVIPESIPNVPTVCKITVSIDYVIYLWRHAIETNSTSEFNLIPRQISATSLTATSQLQLTAPSQFSFLAPFTNNTPDTQSPQSETSQPLQTPLLSGLVGGAVGITKTVTGGL